MPDIYEIEKDGEIYEVEANSVEEAVAAMSAMGGGAPAAPQPTAPPPPTTGHPGIGSPAVRAVFDRADASAASLRQEAMEHPIRTAAMIGAPTGIGILARAAKPFVGPTLTAVGKFIEQPVVGGLMGAMQGYNGRDMGSALQGGLMGAATGTVLGKGLGKLGARMNPPPNPNAGGRLVPRSTPSVNEALDDALQSARTPGIMQPKSVSLPEQGRGPSVTMSPKAMRAAEGRPAPKGGPRGALDAGMEKMYQELARKPILSPEEQQIFDRLHAVVSARASQMGRSYAARGAQ